MTQLVHEIPGITAELTSPQKRKIALRFELRGRKYFRALDAMAFAGRYHRGTRKDGITPEFDHQITIALYVINLALPEEVLEDLICIILLHDVREDYSDPSKVPAGEPAVTYAMIHALCGRTVADNVELLSKVTNGVKKESAFYFAQIKTSWMALLVKLCDRMHNLSTMHGAFTRAKQIEYIAEAVNDILPLASYGSNTFSRYSAAFENVKFITKLLIALLKTLNEEPQSAEG